MADGETDGAPLTLAKHLSSVRFRAGVEEGRWAILLDAFPELVVRIFGEDAAGTLRISMDFQLICDGFPIESPFIQRWDVSKGERPVPPTPEQSPPGVVDALKAWNDSPAVPYGGIYRPWQRYAATHNDWANLRPDLAWHRDRHITFILEKLYELVSEQAIWQAIRASA